MLGFVTVAGLNQTQMYVQNSPSETPRFLKAIPASGIDAHGIWSSADNTRIYTVNEHSDTVDVIDTLNVGQEGQALIYVAGAVTSGNSTQNLGNQGLSEKVANKLVSIGGNTTHQGNSSALITIRVLQGLDMFQVIGRNIELNTTYVASAACATCNRGIVSLVEFSASMKIAGTNDCGTAPQVLGFFEFFDVYDINSLVVSRK